jgi:methionyl-tRNA formyltransferase
LLTDSATPSVPRVVFFAHGSIGSQIVQFALDYNRSSVSGIVMLRGDDDAANLVATDNRRVPRIEFDAANTEETCNKIQSLNPNIIILAWWPYILRPQFLRLGQLATLNLHPSLLPHGRGKDPNFWAIVEESRFGVTIHHVDAEIDSGDIAFQREIAYGWEDTGKSLYEKATKSMMDLFCECYPRIVAFDIPRRKQDSSKGSFHRRSELDDRSLMALDCKNTIREMLNLLRARTFEPHPACRFVDGESTYEVRVTIRKVGD